MAIITISREMGSGGDAIAQEVADKLGYSLVNGETIKKEAPAYGLTPEALEKADEKPPVFVVKLDEQKEADFHMIELIVLQNALKGNVVIYGRGGQDVLRDIQSVFRVRVCAPFEDRVERVAEKEWLDPDYAAVLIRKCDQQRAGFIKYYFDRDWYDMLCYDLIVNTARLSEETAVDLICEGVEDRHLVGQKDQSKKVLKNLILQKQVEIALLTIPQISGQHLQLTSVEGAITLTGHVHSEEQRLLVLDTVKKVEGVKQVTDKLKVQKYRAFTLES